VRPVDRNLVEDLVAANRILASRGILDGFGHVSVRQAERPDRFLMARSMAPALVTADDIVEHDLDGRAVASGISTYLERFIHCEIYRARPDVHAIVHSHSPALIAFGVVESTPLRAVCHTAAFLGTSTPVFEIREAAGPATDMLIRSPELGRALTQSLGSSPLVLMRGHGSTVVGANLPQVVYRAIYAELNARLQSEAMRSGAVTYLTEDEARLAAETNDGAIGRSWELWRRAI